MGGLFTEKSSSYLMMKNGRIAKFVAEPRATQTKAKRELLPKFHKLKENVQITNERLQCTSHGKTTFLAFFICF